MKAYTAKKIAGLPLTVEDIQREENDKQALTEKLSGLEDVEDSVDTEYGGSDKDDEDTNDTKIPTKNIEDDGRNPNIEDSDDELDDSNSDDKDSEGSEMDVDLDFKDEDSEEEEVVKENLYIKIQESAEDATVWDLYAGDSDKDESPSPYPEENDKIALPAEVKKALVKEIEELYKATMYKDELTRTFYNTCANAMSEVLSYLEQETVHGMKMAQICMGKYMSPIVQKFPDIVHDFITRGGKPQTVTQLFKTIREIK